MVVVQDLQSWWQVREWAFMAQHELRGDVVQVQHAYLAGPIRQLLTVRDGGTDFMMPLASPPL